MRNRFVIIDTETTGTHQSARERIIQIGLVLIEGGKIVDRFSALINPHKPLSKFVENLTGITANMLEGAPAFKDIADVVIRYLNDAYFVAHNVPFDLSFIMAELKRAGKPQQIDKQIDTVELARILYPEAESYQLRQLAQTFALNHDLPHRADSDAIVTAELFLILLEKMKQLPVHTLQQLKALEPGLKSDLASLLDEEIQAKQSTDVTQSYTLYKDIVIRKQKQEMRAEQPVANKSDPKASFTPLEAKMYQAVKQAFDFNNHLLLEMDSKVSKKPYFLQAIHYAKREKRPVLISAHSALVKKQLLENDLPSLQSGLAGTFQVSLLKDQTNYICLHKFSQFMEETGLDNYDLVLATSQILVWLTETTVGDMEALQLPSGGRLHMHKMSGCLASCAGPCFYKRKQEEAERADVIIVGHDLLVKDAAAEKQVIPDYTHVIIDEAHHFEAALRNYYSRVINYYSFQSLVGKLEAILTEDQFLNQRFTNQVTEMSLRIDVLFKMMKQFVIEEHDGEKSDVGKLIYSLKGEGEGGLLWTHILNEVKSLYDEFSILGDKFSQASNKRLIPDLQVLVADIQHLLQQLDMIILEDQDHLQTWLEIDEKEPFQATRIISRPVTVKQEIDRLFLKKKQSVIMASSALTVDASFHYMEAKFGFNRYPVMKLSLNDQSQLNVFKLKDIQLSGLLDNQAETVATLVHQLQTVVCSKILVLFPSYDLLAASFENLHPKMAENLHLLVSQGITGNSKDKLIKRFKQFGKTILFGTMNYWDSSDFFNEKIGCLMLVGQNTELKFKEQLDILKQSTDQTRFLVILQDEENLSDVFPAALIEEVDTNELLTKITQDDKG